MDPKKFSKLALTIGTPQVLDPNAMDKHDIDIYSGADKYTLQRPQVLDTGVNDNPDYVRAALSRATTPEEAGGSPLGPHVDVDVGMPKVMTDADQVKENLAQLARAKTAEEAGGTSFPRKFPDRFGRFRQALAR